MSRKCLRLVDNHTLSTTMRSNDGDARASLEISLEQLRDSLRQVVGGTQVFAEEAHFARNFAVDESAAIARSQSGAHIDFGCSRHSGHLALGLTALGEFLDGGVQRHQIRNSVGRAIAAAKHFLECASLAYLLDDVL